MKKFVSGLGEIEMSPAEIAAFLAQQDLDTAAIQANLPRLPHLEPDQFWFGLRVAGYEDNARAWVASLNEPESPNYNPVEWAGASAKLEFAKYFERDHPFIEAARLELAISPEELDALWLYALG